MTWTLSLLTEVYKVMNQTITEGFYAKQSRQTFSIAFSRLMDGQMYYDLELVPNPHLLIIIFLITRQSNQYVDTALKKNLVQL